MADEKNTKNKNEKIERAIDLAFKKQMEIINEINAINDKIGSDIENKKSKKFVIIPLAISVLVGVCVGIFGGPLLKTGAGILGNFAIGGVSALLSAGILLSTSLIAKISLKNTDYKNIRNIHSELNIYTECLDYIQLYLNTINSALNRNQLNEQSLEQIKTLICGANGNFHLISQSLFGDKTNKLLKDIQSKYIKNTTDTSAIIKDLETTLKIIEDNHCEVSKFGYPSITSKETKSKLEDYKGELAHVLLKNIAPVIQAFNIKVRMAEDNFLEQKETLTSENIKTNVNTKKKEQSNENIESNDNSFIA